MVFQSERTHPFVVFKCSSCGHFNIQARQHKTKECQCNRQKYWLNQDIRGYFKSTADARDYVTYLRRVEFDERQDIPQSPRAKLIHNEIISADTISATQIAEKLSLSKQVVHYYLKRFEGAGVLLKIRKNIYHSYYSLIRLVASKSLRDKVEKFYNICLKKILLKFLKSRLSMVINSICGKNTIRQTLWDFLPHFT
jgi:predicted transcriptional regulator